MNYRITLGMAIIIAALAFQSCGETKKGADEKKEMEAAIPVALPVLPGEEIAKLANEATLIDFIFYDLPVSVNFNERNSIVQMCNFLSNQAPVNKGQCQPIAVGIFTSGMDELAKADLFFDDKCAYFAFHNADGKGYAYENQLNAQGVQYFTKVLESAKSAKPQQ